MNMRNVCVWHDTSFPTWSQHISHMSASSSVCWFHVGNDVSCHTHTFLIFIQIYIVSETCDSANYVDTVNGISMPASRWGPRVTDVTRGCRSALTRVFQYSLSHAYVHSSRHELVLGASISKSPGWGALNISKAACFSMRVLSIPRMWPSHCNFLSLIHFSRSNVLPSVASSLIDLSVITNRQNLLLNKNEHMHTFDSENGNGEKICRDMHTYSSINMCVNINHRLHN